MKPETKDKILHRAGRIFFAEGFAVGIDRVTFECDVAKMTIYSEFRSKDGLICALLDEVRRTLAERIAKVIEPGLPAPMQLRAVFNLVCYGMNDPALQLGLGVRALAEFPSPKQVVHQAALALDEAMLKHLQSGEEPGHATSLAAARQLLLLAKGCFLMAPLLGLKGSREIAQELAALHFHQLNDRSGVPGGAVHRPGPPLDRGGVVIKQLP